MAGRTELLLRVNQSREETRTPFLSITCTSHRNWRKLVGGAKCRPAETTNNTIAIAV